MKSKSDRILEFLKNNKNPVSAEDLLKHLNYYNEIEVLEEVWRLAYEGKVEFTPSWKINLTS